MFVRGSETITVESSADVTRRRSREWILFQQFDDVAFTLEQTHYQSKKPWILLRTAEGGKPHLPIKPRLMRRAPAWRALHFARFPFEFIRPPINPVSTAFDYNFAPVFRHDTEKSVTIRNAERLNALVDNRQGTPPFCFRFECGENKPRVQWECQDQDDSGR